MKSGNFLEPSGPLQVCNGTALPLPLPLPVLCIYRWLLTQCFGVWQQRGLAHISRRLEETICKLGLLLDYAE